MRDIWGQTKNSELSLFIISSQLPETVCTFSELNYTLIIENNEGNIKEEVDTFPDDDSSVIKEIIRLDLKENQEYSLKLRVQAQSQTVTSQKHIFSKLQYKASFTPYSQRRNLPLSNY